MTPQRTVATHVGHNSFVILEVTVSSFLNEKALSLLQLFSQYTEAREMKMGKHPHFLAKDHLQSLLLII